MGWGMQQLTLATAGFERYAKTTRRAAFLAVRADRTVLSEAGQRPPAGRGRADAADLFLAAMVQPVGPGSGGGASVHGAPSFAALSPGVMCPQPADKPRRHC